MFSEKLLEVVKDEKQVVFVGNETPAGRKDGAKTVKTRNLALHRDAGPIYQVAELFKERCLRKEASLLWPGSRAWTLQNLERMTAVFESVLPQPGRGFYDIWQERMSQEHVDVHRVAADLVAFYHLFPADLTGEAKLLRLKRMILWKLSEEQPVFTLLERPYASYIGTTGRIYFARIAQHLSFFLAFARAAKTARANLDDVQSAKIVAAEASVGRKYASPARHVLLHLLFPTEIEGILSQKHRDKILAAFPELAGKAEDTDVALSNIRAALRTRFGRADFDYYRPDIRVLWDLKPLTKPRPKKSKPQPSSVPEGPAVKAEPQAPRSWIFQGNPRVRDISNEIRFSTEINWPLRQYRGHVRPGDRVYLWESGRNGGIIGVAEVSDLPGAPPAASEQMQLAFACSGTKRKRTNPREAVLKILKAIEPALQRDRMCSEKELAHLAILRQPRGTNFPVTSEEDTVLRSMIEATPQPASSSTPNPETTAVIAPALAA